MSVRGKYIILGRSSHFKFEQKTCYCVCAKHSTQNIKFVSRDMNFLSYYRVCLRVGKHLIYLLYLYISLQIVSTIICTFDL